MPDILQKSITVVAPPERAFRLWVEGIDAWWPKTHSVSKDAETRIFMEGRLGGRFFERASDGTEHDFGSVVTYDPPNHLAYDWFLGSGAEMPSLVDIRFTAVADGTRVDIEQRGPELIGELWEQRQSAFSSAWDNVLPAYATYCTKEEARS